MRLAAGGISSFPSALLGQLIPISMVLEGAEVPELKISDDIVRPARAYGSELETIRVELRKAREGLSAEAKKDKQTEGLAAVRELSQTREAYRKHAPGLLKALRS